MPYAIAIVIALSQTILRIRVPLLRSQPVVFHCLFIALLYPIAIIITVAPGIGRRSLERFIVFFLFRGSCLQGGIFFLLFCSSGLQGSVFFLLLFRVSLGRSQRCFQFGDFRGLDFLGRGRGSLKRIIVFFLFRGSCLQGSVFFLLLYGSSLQSGVFFLLFFSGSLSFTYSGF